MKSDRVAAFSGLRSGAQVIRATGGFQQLWQSRSKIQGISILRETAFWILPFGPSADHSDRYRWELYWRRTFCYIVFLIVVRCRRSSNESGSAESRSMAAGRILTELCSVDRPSSPFSRREEAAYNEDLKCAGCTERRENSVACIWSAHEHRERIVDLGVSSTFPQTRYQLVNRIAGD